MLQHWGDQKDDQKIQGDQCGTTEGRASRETMRKLLPVRREGIKAPAVVREKEEGVGKMDVYR